MIVGLPHKWVVGSPVFLLKEFICMSIVNNYFHFNQTVTIYRVAKSSKSMKSIDISESDN